MKYIKNNIIKYSVFFALLFNSMSLNADSLDKKTNIESNVKLFIKVISSKKHKSPNGTIVYPVEYTILNQTNEVLYVFYTQQHYELMVDLIKENGVKEEIYPCLLMGHNREKPDPIFVKPNESIVRVNDIPADIFNVKNNKLVCAIGLIYGTKDKLTYLKIYSDPLPSIVPSPSTAASPSITPVAASPTPTP